MLNEDKFCGEKSEIIKVMGNAKMDCGPNGGDRF